MIIHLISILIAALVAVIYIIPSIIALRKKHHRIGVITILNIALGWTGVIWLGLFLYTLFTRSKA